jgi:hypothetical protein
MLVPQTIRNAICLVLASAGIRIPISSATTGSEAGGTTIPAMARPRPFNWPALFSILTKPTIPRITAGIAVTRQVKGLRIASTSDVIASPLVLATGAGAVVETLVNTQLQERHTWASSGFSVPHLGQYILVSPYCSLIFGFLYGYFSNP